MHIADTKETSAKDLATTAAAKDGDEVPTGHEAAEPSSRPSSPDELPPSYTPSPHTGRSHRDIPTSRRGPPCTCPRHHTAANPAQNPEGSEGPNWEKVIGVAAVAVAAPVLVTAGAALVLPVIGFASSGVVGGSIAATIQSSVYGGFTCGVFSVFQSVGATIVAPSVVSTLTAASAAAAGGVAIYEGSQKSDGVEGEDAHGAAGGGQNAARVECSCAACECDESCDCACRRRGRRG